MMKEIRAEYNEKENEIRFLLNTKFYPLEAIILAANNFISDFWVLVDGNPSEILVCIKPKKDEKIIEWEKVVLEFINHVVAGIKELIIHE